MKLNLSKLTFAEVKLWLESIDRKTLIQNGLLGGALFVFVFFLFLPLSFQAKKLSREANQLKQKINQANVKIIKIPEMIKQKDLFGARIQKIRQQFFEPQETDLLIEIMSKAAADSGVKISASRPSAKSLELPSPFDKKYIPVSYELVVEGSYHGIGKFINLFEQFPSSFAVHSLQIVESTEKTGFRQAELTLTAFIKHPSST